MIKNIDHIGIAVKSLDETLPLYTETLNLELEGIETVESQGVKVAFILAGNTRLELLEALSPSSPIAKFIDKRVKGFIMWPLVSIVSKIELKKLKNQDCA